MNHQKPTADSVNEMHITKDQTADREQMMTTMEMEIATTTTAKAMVEAVSIQHHKNNNNKDGRTTGEIRIGEVNNIILINKIIAQANTTFPVNKTDKTMVNATRMVRTMEMEDSLVKATAMHEIQTTCKPNTTNID